MYGAVKVNIVSALDSPRKSCQSCGRFSVPSVSGPSTTPAGWARKPIRCSAANWAKSSRVRADEMPPIGRMK